MADEIVDWFNQVDTAHRTDHREFNVLNFARFDTKLEPRLAEEDAKWERRMATQGQAMSRLEVRLISWTVGLWIAALGRSIRCSSFGPGSSLRTSSSRRSARSRYSSAPHGSPT